MHIEPGVVTGAKLLLSYATAAGGFFLAGRMAMDTIRESGLGALALRSVITTGAVLTFFQVMPHFPVGVSEVHFILGSTLFLLFGGGAASIGLALGLLIQGLVFAPFDLPQYGMNVTTLLVPLWAMAQLARRIIAPGTAYVDLSYLQALKLSTAYQAGVVAWVAFWVVWGEGFGIETLGHIATFGAAYMSVILLEPLADLAVLGIAKSARGLASSAVFTRRLTA